MPTEHDQFCDDTAMPVEHCRVCKSLAEARADERARLQEKVAELLATKANATELEILAVFDA